MHTTQYLWTPLPLPPPIIKRTQLRGQIPLAARRTYLRGRGRGRGIAGSPPPLYPIARCHRKHRKPKTLYLTEAWGFESSAGCGPDVRFLPCCSGAELGAVCRRNPQSRSMLIPHATRARTGPGEWVSDMSDLSAHGHTLPRRSCTNVATKQRPLFKSKIILQSTVFTVEHTNNAELVHRI